MNPIKDKYDIGVIVGRFQVPELSHAHKQLIQVVKESHKQYIIAVGVSPTLGTKKHPLGYTVRMQMIKKEFPDAIITHIVDQPSDEKWSHTLDFMIRALCPIGSVCLYGGRDSFIKSYTGIYNTFELALISDQEGTKIRQETGKVVCDSVDFRKGIIFACQNQYPKVYPTVDIAVIKNEGGIKEVLMGRRTVDDLYQFPGGFVDPTDESLEDAAKRELTEELSVAAENPVYIGSCLIKDWRYTTPDERIMTSFIQMNYTYGGTGVIDEFADSSWIHICKTSLAKVKEGHRPLFEMLLKKHPVKKGMRKEYDFSKLKGKKNPHIKKITRLVNE